MANKDLREGTEIVFADGKKRTIYPLTIRQLRKFMKVIKKLTVTEQASDIEDRDIELMVEAVSIALEKVDKELSDNKEEIEDVIDIKSFNQILVAAMGTDPNG